MNERQVKLETRKRQENEMIAKVANEVYRLTRENGGCTYQIGKGIVSKGYAVSCYKERECVIVESLFPLEAEHIEQYIHFNKDLLIDGHSYALGTWVNDGKVYLDVTSIFHDREIAKSVGVIHKQEAIYDLEKGEEIRL